MSTFCLPYACVCAHVCDFFPRWLVCALVHLIQSMWVCVACALCMEMFSTGWLSESISERLVYNSDLLMSSDVLFDEIVTASVSGSHCKGKCYLGLLQGFLPHASTTVYRPIFSLKLYSIYPVFVVVCSVIDCNGGSRQSFCVPQFWICLQIKWFR